MNSLQDPGPDVKLNSTSESTDCANRIANLHRSYVRTVTAATGLPECGTLLGQRSVICRDSRYPCLFAEPSCEPPLFACVCLTFPLLAHRLPPAVRTTFAETSPASWWPHLVFPFAYKYIYIYIYMHICIHYWYIWYTYISWLSMLHGT